MIRRCGPEAFDTILEIVNAAAQAYRGVIPADRWQEPYMPRDELVREIAEGVAFWGYEAEGELVAVAGLQDRGNVALIRHAYVRPSYQRRGIGSALLEHLSSQTSKPILIGTWAASHWAIAFYQKHGYRLVEPDEKNVLLRRYWSIPERQVVASVVLAGPRWFAERSLEQTPGEAGPQDGGAGRDGAGG